MKLKEILEATFTSHTPYNPNSDAGPYNMSNPGNEDISVDEQEEEGPEYCVYFDFTGSGQGPKPIAGPFKTEREANQYAHENEYVGGNYFVDVYHQDTQEEEEQQSKTGLVWYWTGANSQGQIAGPFDNQQQAMEWYKENVERGLGSPEDEGFDLRPFNPRLPVEQDMRDDEDQHHDDDTEYLCGACNGSGEGMYDGSTCGSCKGSGIAGKPQDY